MSQVNQRRMVAETRQSVHVHYRRQCRTVLQCCQSDRWWSLSYCDWLSVTGCSCDLSVCIACCCSSCSVQHTWTYWLATQSTLWWVIRGWHHCLSICLSVCVCVWYCVQLCLGNAVAILQCNKPPVTDMLY